MIDYGKPASNQMEADLESQGAQAMREAHEWIEAHPDAWEGYLRVARSDSVHGMASPNFVLQSVRHYSRVSVRNALAAPLARIAMEQDSRIKFRTARSKVDGFCEVVL